MADLSAKILPVVPIEFSWDFQGGLDPTLSMHAEPIVLRLNHKFLDPTDHKKIQL